VTTTTSTETTTERPALNAAQYLETELFSTRSARVGQCFDTRVAGFGSDEVEGVNDLLGDSRSRLVRVSARAAYQEVLFGRAVLVDIRTQAQRDQEGEVHADLGPVVIERKTLEWCLDPRHPSSLPIADFRLRVIVICQDGYTSSLAAEVLLRLGIQRSTDIIGGFAAWRAAGLPRHVGARQVALP
jgi:rhodanese-related sulfurtransferase